MDLRKTLLISLMSLVLSQGLVENNYKGEMLEGNYYVRELEDSLEGDSEDSDSSSDSNSNALIDYISNKESFTGEQLAEADKKLSPITNLFGYFVGGGVIYIFGAVFVITILDLVYIVIPPLRGVLYKGDIPMNGSQGAYGGGAYGGAYGGGAYGAYGGA